MAVDRVSFRRCLGKFVTGVTVVTTRMEDKIHGMTANSFTSVSLSPPLILFCVSHGTRTLEMIRQSGVFAVNILSESQAAVSERFAGMLPEDSDRFEGLEIGSGTHTGCPIIDGALATLECRLTASYPGGDHEIMLAEVIHVEQWEDPGKPLLYFASNYYQFPDDGRLERPRRAPVRTDL